MNFNLLANKGSSSTKRKLNAGKKNLNKKQSSNLTAFKKSPGELLHNSDRGPISDQLNHYL